MSEIDKINDKTFKQIFQEPGNVTIFLKKVLPEEIKKRIVLSELEIGPTNYVSKEFKEYFSDVVVKTKIRSKGGEKLPADICFILEHKTEGKMKIFLQFLKYMVQEWQGDIDSNKPLHIIIPIVFYHGKDPWKIPHSFVDQFDVDDELKKFLLDYRYILFDTRSWDFRNESNEELRENVFLLTAMALMKCAYTDETETIEEIFRFWQEKGFAKDVESVIFFLMYISETKKISRDRLKKMLEKSKIEGGEIMQTLAQRLRDEGKKIGYKEGTNAEKIRTAKELIRRGISTNIIAEATGLSQKKIEELAEQIL